METAASFEARFAPRPYSTDRILVQFWVREEWAQTTRNEIYGGPIPYSFSHYEWHQLAMLKTRSSIVRVRAFACEHLIDGTGHGFHQCS